MILNTGVTRAASLLAQVVLGWILSKTDFGLYAVAISASTLAAVFKDGGVRQILIQRQRDYDMLVGPTFWMAGAFNAATGAVIALLAWPLAWAYGDARLVPMMLVIALSQPLSTPGAILSTRLQIALRFREAASIQTVAALVRYVGAVVLALAGFGAMSFVLPLPVIALVEWAMAWWYTRDRLWTRPAGLSLWWDLFRQAKWIVIGTFGIAGINMGANVVIGLFVPLTVVGVYFFAYQIVIQIGLLLSANLVSVLAPVFARINDDPGRERTAAAKALRQVMLLASPLCLGLAATFAPLEFVIWRGRWADAADAVYIIGMLYPASVISSVAVSILQAKGLFRAWGISLIAIAAATVVSAAAGAAVHGSAIGIALYAGVGTMVSSLAVTMIGMARVGIQPGQIANAMAPVWLLAIGAAAIAMNLDLYLLTGAPAIVRVLAAGVSFCAVFGLSVRALAPDYLREGLTVTPAPVRNIAMTLLRLR